MSEALIARACLPRQVLQVARHFDLGVSHERRWRAAETWLGDKRASAVATVHIQVADVEDVAWRGHVAEREVALAADRHGGARGVTPAVVIKVAVVGARAPFALCLSTSVCVCLCLSVCLSVCLSLSLSLSVMTLQERVDNPGHTRTSRTQRRQSYTQISPLKEISRLM